jgi:heme oxygenase (biliverdin-IX-beta and delta-forming)
LQGTLPVQVPSRLLTRLNFETRGLHAESDACWVDLLTGSVSVEEYVGALVAAYGFEGPVESAVALTRGVSAILPLRQRARSGFIVQDLLAVGFSPSRIARLPQCCQIVPFRDVPEALGWLYVVERATLLHDMARRHVQACLPELNAFAYLSAYDGVAGLRWQELGHALDAVAASDTDVEDEIIAAARDAFATQRMWFATDVPHVARF